MASTLGAERLRLGGAARSAAIGCTLALAFASTALAQEVGGGSSAAAGAGASSTGATASPAVGGSGPTGSAGPAESAGTGLGPWGGLGLRLPDLAARGIEPPQFIFGVRGMATLSDNLRHQRDGRSALLLEASPYVIARSTAPRASYNLAYQMRNFMRIGDDSDLTLLRHNMNGRGSFAIAGDNLWLDVSAFMGSINSSPDGALSIDPSSSFDNRSNYRRYAVAPWYQDRLGSWATYRMRYELSRSESSSDATLADWTHHASAAIDGIDRGGKWNWGWHGFYQSRDFGDVTLDRRFSAGTLHYRYSHRLRLSASIEYEQIDNVFNDEGDDHGWGPALAVQWNPNSRISISGHVADRYYGTVGSGQISWSTRRTTLGLSASKSVMTSSDSALLALDPLALARGPGGTPNNLISDLIAGGLLPPDGIPIGRAWVTDNAVFDRRVTAFWALRGASRTLTLSAWASTRETAATFSAPATGGIRGSGTGESFSFDGELRERGIGLSFSQSLDART
ncbi:MAG: TIGR03016 family PEP-CTERM system-associated outer membrane protein, partial [Limnobacter sp.]|nr:TIGR03016 family PEP-CTERM system-associated outer membrane protein [Limnobacter sp.]